MSLLVVPYNPSMRLGSGYNSYTQQTCIDHAVVRDPDILRLTEPLPEGTTADIAQTVTFRSEVLDKISDLTDVLNINGNLTVKAANIANATGAGAFINSNKIKESDLNFLLSCKVVNQTVMDETLTKFSPLPNVKSENFTDVYGDCFISGFQIGGEFTALISIKVRDKSQLQEISAKATIAFTTPGFGGSDNNQTSGNTGGGQTGSSGLSIDAEAQITKTRNEVLAENEVTISVSWTGGGQGLKSATSDWNYETLREVAIRFPELVARTPVRTDAILTKYTALKSFYAASASTSLLPLSYENAGIYTTALQDAYLEYKNLYKEMHLLAIDVDAGRKTLVPVDETKISVSAVVAAQEPSTSLMQQNTAIVTKPTQVGHVTVGGKVDGAMEPETTPIQSKIPQVAGSTTPETTSLIVPAVKAFKIAKPYDSNIAGLERAKIDVRIMMSRIVVEVDAVSKNPDIAMLEDRSSPFIPPLLFKQYIPGHKTVPST